MEKNSSNSNEFSDSYIYKEGYFVENEYSPVNDTKDEE